MKKRFLLFLTGLWAIAASAEIRLPALFTDGCVLQRHSDVRVWGWATAKQQITISPSWAEPMRTRADQTGYWEVFVSTGYAGGPHSLTISGDGEKRVQDILFGEVWVCSGQSNMEWSMKASAYPERVIQQADHPTLRLFKVPRRTEMSPIEDVKATWTVCSPEAAREFSAVAYWFGRELQQRFGIPVGLIQTSWGGTPAEAWTPAEALAQNERLQIHLERKETVFSAPSKEQHQLILQQFDLISLQKSPGYGQQPNALWAQPAFDDSSWKTHTLPMAFTEIGLGEYDGAVWFRRTMDLGDVPEKASGTVMLEPIDDQDEFWINGTRIGRTLNAGAWNKRRKYPVPAGILQSGENTLTIRALDYQNDGRVGAPKGQVGTLAVAGEKHSLAGEWRYREGLGIDELPPVPRPASRRVHHTPTALYNGMVAPLTRYTIRGAIWYQGESNRNRGDEYHVLFPTMIQSWRDKWNQGTFPFYYVQIAPFKYDGKHTSAEVREAQRKTLELPQTGMAVITDIAEENDIHPKNKHDVGERLARLALHHTYGVTRVVPSGPLYREVEFKDGKALLHFDWAEGLKVPAGEEPAEFLIAGKERDWKPATARIEGETVIVSHPEVPQPDAVRFGWKDYSVPNLFNAADLPASPFRTDADPLSEDDF